MGPNEGKKLKVKESPHTFTNIIFLISFTPVEQRIPIISLTAILDQMTLWALIPGPWSISSKFQSSLGPNPKFQYTLSQVASLTILPGPWFISSKISSQSRPHDKFGTHSKSMVNFIANFQACYYFLYFCSMAYCEICSFCDFEG